jgi:mRNA interferase RelE/StbE
VPSSPVKIVVAPEASRDLKSLARRPPNSDILRRIDEAILALSVNPRPAGAAKLAPGELWRIRVGDYRVLYEIDDRVATITIARIRHRSEAYREP